VANEDLKVLGFGLFNKGGEARQIAQYIQRHEGPGTAIVVFPSDQALVLANYYHGVNRLVPLPRPLPLDRFDYRNLVVPSEGAVEEALVGRKMNLCGLSAMHLVTMDGVSLTTPRYSIFSGTYEVSGATVHCRHGRKGSCVGFDYSGSQS